MARNARSVQIEIDDLKAKLAAAVQENYSLDTRERMEHDEVAYGEIRKRAVSRHLRNEIHVNKNVATPSLSIIMTRLLRQSCKPCRPLLVGPARDGMTPVKTLFL